MKVETSPRQALHPQRINLKKCSSHTGRGDSGAHRILTIGFIIQHRGVLGRSQTPNNLRRSTVGPVLSQPLVHVPGLWTRCSQFQLSILKRELGFKSLMNR